jgi:hypothetical protein
MLVWSSHQFYACVYGHGAYGGQNPTTSPSHEANRCAPPRTSLVLATATRRSATPTWQSQHDILYCPTHHWVDLKEHVQFWVLPFYQKTFTLLRCAQFSRQGFAPDGHYKDSRLRIPNKWDPQHGSPTLQAMLRQSWPEPQVLTKWTWWSTFQICVFM